MINYVVVACYQKERKFDTDSSKILLICLKFPFVQNSNETNESEFIFTLVFFHIFELRASKLVDKSFQKNLLVALLPI